MKKITIESFIIKANLLYNNQYNYSNCKYNGMKVKVDIICNTHGNFYQTPDSHLHGHGCPNCAIDNNKQKLIKSKLDFVIEANAVHLNKYDYSNSIYIGARMKIEILCINHGQFYQTPDSHLHGRGCPKCVNRNTTTNEFIERGNTVHENKYNYSLTNYINPTTKVKIICLNHGMFEQQPNSHLRGSGCPICKSSKGEINVIKFLKLNHFEFIREKKFLDCKNKYPLPFDFYLPKQNILIEYDGKHHASPVRFGGISIKKSLENFQFTKQCDKIKNKYAKDNNIKLIRIPHSVRNVEEYLKFEITL